MRTINFAYSFYFNSVCVPNNDTTIEIARVRLKRTRRKRCLCVNRIHAPTVDCRGGVSIVAFSIAKLHERRTFL